jgi:hypothetical protein
MIIRVAQGFEAMSALSIAGKMAASRRCLQSVRASSSRTSSRPVLAEGVDVILGKDFGEFVQPIEPEEKIAQRDRSPDRAAAPVALVEAVGIEFVEIDPFLGGGWV